MKIDRLGVTQLDDLATLFDAYRVWYGQVSDVDGARRFLQQRLDADESVIYGAYDAETLVAFTQLYPSYSSVSMGATWILNDLYVHEDYRGGGYGRALMEAACEHARATGAIRLELSTAHTNKRAQGLYEDLGYVLDEDFRHYSLALRRD